MPTHIALQLLRYCALPRLSFLARTTPPDQLHSSAIRFDQLVLQTFLHIVQLTPAGMRQQPVTEAEMHTQIQLPLSKGGMGLGPVARISAAAYFASAATILPDFIRAFPSIDSISFTETELCAQLEECRRLLSEQGVPCGSSVSESATDGIAVDNTAAESDPLPVTPAKRRGRPPKKPPVTQTRSAKKENSRGVTAAELAFKPTVIPAALLYTPTQLFNTAHDYLRSCNSEDSSGFLHSQHIQHAATELIEQRAYTQLHDQSSLRRKVLLTSCRAKHSSDFLSTLPTQPCFRMSDASVRLAIRHRLGLLPYDALSTQHCLCRASTPFTDDPDHFHSCERTRHSLMTQRHNNIVQVIRDLAVHAGFMAIREPNMHVRPADVADLPALSEKYNQHADLLLLRHDLKLYIDVTVTRPTNASHLNRSGASASHTPLVSTKAPAQLKHNKYDAIAQTNNYRMIPFVLESYGGFGVEASALLQQLSAFSQELSPREFLLHAHRRLSVTLQSSNADIAQLAMQHHQLAQHTTNRTLYDRWKALAAVRQAHYVKPYDGDKLARRVSLTVAAAEASATQLDELTVMDESTQPFVHAHRVSFADATSRSVTADGRISIAAA